MHCWISHAEGRALFKPDAVNASTNLELLCDFNSTSEAVFAKVEQCFGAGSVQDCFRLELETTDR